jgi:AcrR family transcriptional regulator
MNETGLKHLAKTGATTKPCRPEIRPRPLKKATQHALLLDTAYGLFRRDGFDAVRLQDIAAHANVSVQTLYNHFGGKRDLLIEILIHARRDSAATCEQIIKDPPQDPSEAVAALVFANVNVIRSPRDKRLWREIFSAVALCHDRERSRFAGNQRSFKAHIRQLLDHFVRNDIFPANYPLDIATEIVFAVNAYNVRYLIAHRKCTPEDIRERTRSQVALLWSRRPGKSPFRQMQNRHPQSRKFISGGGTS